MDSGTDRQDVVSDAKVLVVYGLIDEIADAQPHDDSCSKEAVLSRMLEGMGQQGGQLAVMGESNVEICLARQAGA